MEQTSSKLKENKLDELFKYLDAVANNLENESAEECARRLYGYLQDNRDGFISYLKRVLELPQTSKQTCLQGV